MSIVSPVSGRINVPFPKNEMIECVWLNGVLPELLTLSSQSDGDKCISDDHKGVELIAVVLVSPSVVAVLLVCCSSIIIINYTISS